MSQEEMTAGSLHLKASIEDGAVSVTWFGQSVSATPGTEILPFFERLAPSYEGKRLRIDFRRLEYMNSSSVRPVIELIQQASAKGTAVEVLYHSSIHWQRLTFKLLEILAKDWKNVRVAG